MTAAGEGAEAPRRWAYAALWTASIYALIPYTRDLVQFLGMKLGGDPVLGPLFGGIILLVVIAFGAKVVRRPGFNLTRGLWLAGVLAGYGYFMWTIDIAPEKIHFLQYGVLALLVFYALRCHFDTRLLYPQTLAVCFLIGVFDEYLQSLVPRRVGDTGDIFLNLEAVALALIGLATAWAPAGFQPIQRKMEVWATGGLLAGAVVSMGLFMWTVVDFGARFSDPEIGAFNSSFRPEALAKEDSARGAAVAGIVDATTDTDYGDFLIRYSRRKDPYVHEVRVRIFRRDRYLQKATPNTTERIEHLRIAWMENRILEKYYPAFVSQSLRKWPDGGKSLEPELRAAGALNPDYWSPVGGAIVTTYDTLTLWIRIFAMVIGVLTVTAFADQLIRARTRR